MAAALTSFSVASGERAYGPASLWNRWAAMAIDWICLILASYMLVPIPLVLLGITGTACLVAQHIILFMALPVAWRFEVAPGPRALGLRVVQHDGRRPALWRGTLRALVVSPGGFAAGVLAIAAYGIWMGHYPSGAEPDPNWPRLGGFAGLASAYFLSTLAACADSKGRALHDRVSGVLVLEPVVERPTRPAVHPIAGPPRPLRRAYLWLVAAVLGVAVFFSIGVSGFIAAGDWPWAAGFGAFTVGCWTLAWWLCVRIAPRPSKRWRVRWLWMELALAVTWLFFVVISIDSLLNGLWIEGVVAGCASAATTSMLAIASRGRLRLGFTARVARIQPPSLPG